MTYDQVDLPPYPRRQAPSTAAVVPFRARLWNLKRFALIAYALMAVLALSLTCPREALQWLTR